VHGLRPDEEYHETNSQNGDALSGCNFGGGDVVNTHRTRVVERGDGNACVGCPDVSNC
jgi:hypothetical protein